MTINWDTIHKTLLPLKDYEDCCRRFTVSYSYPFVVRSFNFSLPELSGYSQKLLGGDARQRYTGYLSQLTGIISPLHQAGVGNILELAESTDTRAKLELFAGQSGVDALHIVTLLKYLVYWFIPGEKYLSGLVHAGPDDRTALKLLGALEIRTNLQLLQQGLTPLERRSLAEKSGLPVEVITDLVSRVDLSRLPWSSKATISNIIGAGYGSIARLANAEPEKLYADFFAYGKSIGKNLKLGNEIENSYRIAKIVPMLVQED